MLDAARQEPVQLTELLAWRERAQLIAEQRAHAEWARRLELEEQLGEIGREAAERRAELAAARIRVRELEQKLAGLRRVACEAEHAARAARAEAEHAARAARAEVEADRVARAEAEARGEALERALSEHVAGTARAYLAAGELREQLATLLAERSPRSVAAGEDLVAPEPPARVVDPERFSAALSRLREAAAPHEEIAPSAREGAPGRAQEAVAPWLHRAFQQIARRDADAAGRLLLALLPVQGRVHRGALDYDLVLGERKCLRVTVADGRTHVQRDFEPRELSAVQLQLIGEPAGIARLLVAGRWRRRFVRHLAKLRGEREALAAVCDLIRTPLSLRQLVESGVRLDPVLALTVVAAMIEPSWTAGERWILAYEDPREAAVRAHIQVRERKRAVAVAGPPSTAAATTIACGVDELLAVLARERVAELQVRGERRPLELLLGWIARAQDAAA